MNAFFWSLAMECNIYDHRKYILFRWSYISWSAPPEACVRISPNECGLYGCISAGAQLSIPLPPYALKALLSTLQVVPPSNNRPPGEIHEIRPTRLEVRGRRASRAARARNRDVHSRNRRISRPTSPCRSLIAFFCAFGESRLKEHSRSQRHAPYLRPITCHIHWRLTPV